MIYTRHLVILFFLIFITSLPLKALNDKAIKARAEHITFNPSKVIFVASGNAKVNFQDIELSGGTICVDIASSRLVASGNVSLTSEMGEINCDSISINLHSKKCYILASESVEPRVEFDVTTFQIVSSLKDFPGGAFSMDNIINSDLCITGNEIVVQPNETAQIRPAAFWINGSRSMELPFYSFTIGAGASYTTPRVAYTDMGATVDVPVIVSLEEKSMSLAHMKYNSNMGFSVTLEHQQRFSDNASAIFYLDDLNKDAYRKARMQYRHKFGSQTDATLNVDWQNNKDVDVFLNMSHRFSKSNLTFNFRSQYAVSKPEGTPASFELYWRQNPDNFLGSPITYAFYTGLSMRGNTFSQDATWNRNIGLRLTHKPIRIGNTGALIFGVGDEMNWLTTGETRNNLSGTMNLTLGTKFNLDATINRNSYNLDNRNSNYTYGTINLRTSFTNEFSTRLTYTFGEYNARLAENSFSFSNRQVGCFFTYNPSQNFYLSLGGTYDLQNSRMAYAQGDIRFRVGKYCYLRLAPFYDFVSKNTNYTIQVDPILSPLTP